MLRLQLPIDAVFALPSSLLGSNVPLPSVTRLCQQVEPDLTLMSSPVALSAANATEPVHILADEVLPSSDLAVGGHGALAMRDLFLNGNI